MWKYGISVCGLSDVTYDTDRTLLIISVLSDKQDEMLVFAKDCGFANITVIDDGLFDEMESSYIYEYKKKIRIYHMKEPFSVIRYIFVTYLLPVFACISKILRTFAPEITTKTTSICQERRKQSR